MGSVCIYNYECGCPFHIRDYLQVNKSNFGASWEEVGETNELEDTYALSMPSLEEVSHNSTAAGLLTLQDPALTRLVAEAFRLTREGVVEREHTLRPAQSLLRSIAAGLGGAGGLLCTNPASQ